MPKVVDHSVRRAEIVAGFIDLVARNGMAQATSRALADHLGMSNGALWRYFVDKNDLLAETTATVVERTNRRAAVMLAGKDGAEAAVTMVEALLPLEPVSQDEARIVVGFWGLSALDPRAEQPGRPEVDAWAAFISAALTQAVRSGELVADTPIEALAGLFMSHAVNTQIDYVFSGTINRESALNPIREVLNTYLA